LIAQHKREQKESAEAFAKLERQYKATDEKLTEFQTLVKELRITIDNKDKEIVANQRKVEQLNSKVSELEGSKKSLEEHVAKLERKLLSGLYRSSNFLTFKGVGPKSAALLKKNTTLQASLTECQKELEATRSERDSLSESFRAEAQASEEQRAIIQLLKAALDKKAQAIGLEGQVHQLQL
jgi:predicted nuclease with TOPRIM domain